MPILTINPCPFCGSKKIKLISQIETGYDYDFVVCENNDCLTEGPRSNTQIIINNTKAANEAVKKWNNAKL